MNEKEVANYFGLHVGTLRCWRSKGIGPKYIKINDSSIRYCESDIEEYVDEMSKIYEANKEELE